MIKINYYITAKLTIIPKAVLLEANVIEWARSQNKQLIALRSRRWGHDLAMNLANNTAAGEWTDVTKPEKEKKDGKRQVRDGER